MQTLVTTNQLVRKGQTWHQSALLQPKDGTKGTREKDSLNGRERYQTLGKAILGVDPLERPVGFLLNARNRFDGIEQMSFLELVFDVSIDE